MEASIALSYIPQRMQRLGYTSHSIQYIHLTLQPSEEMEIRAYNQYYILLNKPQGIRIESEFGMYDLSLYTNGQQHEHQGRILIKNTTEEINQVDFIQVIPQQEKRRAGNE